MIEENLTFNNINNIQYIIRKGENKISLTEAFIPIYFTLKKE